MDYKKIVLNFTVRMMETILDLGILDKIKSMVKDIMLDFKKKYKNLELD